MLDILAGLGLCQTQIIRIFWHGNLDSYVLANFLWINKILKITEISEYNLFVYFMRNLLLLQ